MTQKLQYVIQLLSSFNTLPEEKQDAIALQVSKVLDEMNDSSAIENDYSEPAGKKDLPFGKRIPDLEKGKIFIADDFDDPLPDSFWLGKE